MRLFAHQTGGVATKRGCSSTEWVVRSPCMAVCSLNGTVHQTGSVITAHGSLVTELCGAVTVHGCSLTTNWWCGHCMRLFALMRGVETERDCSPAEWAVRSLYIAICLSRLCGHCEQLPLVAALPVRWVNSIVL